MKKFCAVFVLSHNEKYHLPIWLKYYGENFGYENLYVLDHDTKDGSTDCLETIDVNHIKVHHDKLNDDNNFMTRTLQDMQVKLLNEYEYIINPDADEFLLPDPEIYLNLKDYVDKMKKQNKKIGRATGFEVLHDRHNEPQIDWDKPLLKQRKDWISVDTYNKPIILGEVRSWSHGKHELFGQMPSNDKNLILCHTNRIDYNFLKNKGNGSIWMISRRRNQNNPGPEFDHLFDNPNWNIFAGAKHSDPQIIPEKWKNFI